VAIQEMSMSHESISMELR
jgi:hypothetical protein